MHKSFFILQMKLVHGNQIEKNMYWAYLFYVQSKCMCTYIVCLKPSLVVHCIKTLYSGCVSFMESLSNWQNLFLPGDKFTIWYQDDHSKIFKVLLLPSTFDPYLQ